MLFTPNDFNSSSVAAICGVCHSVPQVCAETVTPLKNGSAASGPASARPSRKALAKLLPGEKRILGEIEEKETVVTQIAPEQPARL